MKVAQRFIAGYKAQQSKVPEGRPKSSEHIFRIVFDTMLFEEAYEFLFEGLLAMMLFLVFDICDCLIHLRDADAKCSVAFLPGEVSVAGKFIVNPFRRSAFYQLYGFANREGSR